MSALFSMESVKKKYLFEVLFFVWWFSITTYNYFFSNISFVHVWILSAIVCAAYFVKNKQAVKQVRLFNPGLFLIVFGVWLFAAGLMDAHALLGSKMALKFVALGILCLVLASSKIEHSLIKGTFAILMILNIIPFVVDLIAPNLSIITLPAKGARLQNHYNFIGNIWRVGLISALVFLSSSMLSKKKDNYIFYGIAILILGLDESRTGLLLLFFAIGFLFILSYGRNLGKQLVKLVSIGLLLMFIVPFLWLERIPFVSRYLVAIQEIEQPQSVIPGTMPQTNEEIRYETLKRSDSYIRNASLFGHGFNSSDVLVGENQRIPLHNAYLQILNDFGLVGFAIWMLIICFHFIYKPMAVFRFVKTQTDLWPFYVYCAVWPINFMFQPISTELYEWAIYIISSAIVLRSFEARELVVPETQSISDLRAKEV